jgi:hypothetical protein
MTETKSAFRGNDNLKKSNVQIEWTKEMIVEFVKCKDDPIYFAEKYIKIITEDGLVPIKLRDYQKEMMLSMHNNKNTYALQSRQSGKTETIRCFAIHYILFNEHKTVAILADKEATVKEILHKIQITYQALPKWLQVGVVEFNKQSFILENGSRIIVAGTSSNSIRGLTIQCLVLDEFAHISNFDEFYSSVLPTISAGKNTKLILTTTPLGLNHAWKFWKDSEEGRNDFHRIFVPWHRVPGRDENWKRQELAKMSNDLEKFAQEYEVEFLGSSGTLIASWKLKELTHQTPLTQKDGLYQYIQPIADNSYVCIVDVSRGKGLDYSAFSIFDVTSMPYKQACSFRNNLVTPIDYADIIFRVVKLYNNAATLVEINDIGAQVAESLQFDFEYDNVLFTESAGRSGKRITAGFGGNVDKGIRTSKTVKSVGCSILKLLIEQNQLIVNDFETINELSTFSRKGVSYEAESGKHDDMVMGLVLFAWLSDQMYFKELTNINTLAKLREKTDEDIAQDLVPFGFMDNGFTDAENIETSIKGNWFTAVEDGFL